MKYKNYLDEEEEIGTEANLKKLASEALSMNYDDFTKGTDYASLAKRYSQQGQKAMDDTIGKVAARTGGMASSYATAAGNQAYNDWMGNLEDAARSLYDSQRQEKIDNLGIAKSLYDMSYNEQRDNIADKRYLDQIQREDNEAAQGKAQETIAMMLAGGMTMADIQKQYPDLVGNSGYDEGYWNSYESQINAPEKDTGALTDYQKMVIQQYNTARGEDGTGEVPQWLQNEYEKIFGNAPTLERMATQARNANTEAEFQSIVLQISALDQELADTLTAEWEEKNKK